MALPVGVDGVTVSSGNPLTLPDGTPFEGKLLFTGPDVVTVAGQDVLLGGTREAKLVGGEFSITLAANDVAGMSPSGWTYTVTAVLSNAPSWVRHVSLSKASPSVVLADVIVPDPVVGRFTTLVNPADVSGSFLVKENNLNDVTDVATARSNLGLGGSATRDVGTVSGSVAAGDDSRFSNSRTPTGAAGGDLSGTFPNPGVAKVGGVAVSGTPSSGQVLTATGAAAAGWQTPASGGGVSLVTADARVTAGDVALATAASWTIVTAGVTPLSCAIKAAVGDRILASPQFMHTGSGFFLDLAILTSGGAISRFLGSGTSTPLAEGNPAYYPQSGSFPAATGPVQMIVASGEVDGSGKVTVALVYRGSGTETVYDSATYPFYLLLSNLGPQPA